MSRIAKILSIVWESYQPIPKPSADTKTTIYAWALMTSHAHILLRSSEIGLSGFMRRLLTGYAISYNRRHRRWGHLFQNRYKSIICDETDYRNYVKEGIDLGRRPELVGGGLIRSSGGWSAVKALRRAGDRELSDDRILGSGEFVEQIIKEAEGKVKYQLPVKEQNRKIDKFITNLCKNTKVSKKELKSGSRRKEVSGVRSLIAIELVKKQGISLAEVARRVGVSTTAVSKIIRRADQ